MNFKKYLFVGAALMSVSFFAACSDDENEPENPPVEEPGGEDPDEPQGPVSLEDQWCSDSSVDPSRKTSNNNSNKKPHKNK